MNHKRFLLTCGDYRILFVNCSLPQVQEIRILMEVPSVPPGKSRKTRELTITYNTKLKLLNKTGV
ncbi:hypothetical protein C7H09_17185 [Marinobacter fuscus]|uniref:Uncharacterized protein n=1 Tax=Marinobacter fuscus TaxID=2109942 RepID=A0A2T1K3W1_9GAMM|nr:hypothetical protein C7H09_17185 [Marinobacter fuscus]